MSQCGVRAAHCGPLSRLHRVEIATSRQYPRNTGQVLLLRSLFGYVAGDATASVGTGRDVSNQDHPQALRRPTTTVSDALL